MQKIESFDGEYRFLSNFWYSPILHDGKIWPTAEHLFQAAKTDNIAHQELIRRRGSPGLAKSAGRTVTLRADWEQVKINVMTAIIEMKFEQNPELKEKLFATKGMELIEGNTWRDTFWGVCGGIGKNHLGLILMDYRDR